MPTIDEIKIIVRAEVDDAISKMAQFDKTTQGVQTTFGKMRDIMQGPIAAFETAARVVNNAVSAFDSLIMASFNAEKSQAVLASVLRATGADAWTSMNKLNAYSEKMAQLTLFEDDAITSMQGVLLGFRNISGKHYEEASNAILDMSQVMGMDLVSAAQAVGKALDMPAQGMDALSRQGFKFSAEEKELIKTLVAAGKTAEAQDIILKELNKTFLGSAAAAAKTSAGAWMQAKKALDEVKEAAGGATARGVADMADSFAVGATVIAGSINKANKAADEAELIKNFIGGESPSEIKRKLDALGVPYFNFLASLYGEQAKAEAGSKSIIWSEEKRKDFAELKKAIDEAISKWDEYGKAEKRAAPPKGVPMSATGNWWQVGRNMSDLPMGKVLGAGDPQAFESMAERANMAKIAVSGLNSVISDTTMAIAEGEDVGKVFFKSIISNVGSAIMAYGALIEAQAWAIPGFVDWAKVVKGIGITTAGGAIKAGAAAMASGGEGWVDKPTLFMAGEAGREFVSFTPEAKGGRGIVINQYIAGSIHAERELKDIALGGIADATRGY